MSIYECEYYRITCMYCVVYVCLLGNYSIGIGIWRRYHPSRRTRGSSGCRSPHIVS